MMISFMVWDFLESIPEMNIHKTKNQMLIQHNDPFKVELKTYQNLCDYDHWETNYYMYGANNWEWNIISLNHAFFNLKVPLWEQPERCRTPPIQKDNGSSL